MTTLCSEPGRLIRVDQLHVVTGFYAGEHTEQILADWGFNTVANGIIVNTATEKNPDLIKRFLGGITKGIKYSRANPQEAISNMKERFPQTKPKVLLEELKLTFGMLSNKSTKGRALGWQSESDWSTTQNVLSKNGLIKKFLKPT